MKIYYTGTDNGDGSIGVGFYNSKECIDLLEEHDLEGARGEGGGWFEIPDGTEIRGISIDGIEDVREYLTDMGFLEEAENNP